MQPKGIDTTIAATGIRRLAKSKHRLSAMNLQVRRCTYLPVATEALDSQGISTISRGSRR